MLVRPGEAVEQRSLPTVLVAGKGEGNRLPLWQRMFIRPHMISPPLAEAGMLCLLLFPGPCWPLRNLLRRQLQQADSDLSGVSQPQGQLISMDAQFHRIPHRSIFDQGNLRAGDHPHIKKMLPQLSFPANRIDHGGLSGLQIL